MKLIRTEDAVGHVLCHDMTQIIPGEYKDARFRKGHIVAAGFHDFLQFCTLGGVLSDHFRSFDFSCF